MKNTDERAPKLRGIAPSYVFTWNFRRPWTDESNVKFEPQVRSCNDENQVLQTFYMAYVSRLHCEMESRPAISLK